MKLREVIQRIKGTDRAIDPVKARLGAVLIGQNLLLSHRIHPTAQTRHELREHAAYMKGLSNQ